MEVYSALAWRQILRMRMTYCPSGKYDQFNGRRPHVRHAAYALYKLVCGTITACNDQNQPRSSVGSRYSFPDTFAVTNGFRVVPGECYVV
jgi:hypothetical protein